MRTITGLFDTRDQAENAVRSLKDAGIPSGDISIVANNADGSYATDGDDVAADAGTGAGIGAAVGGAGGLLTGLGLLAIPGIGPVVAGGWLLSTVVGAATGAVVGGATGGLIGALTDAGVDERDAHVYAEGVRRGGALVTARVDEAHAETADAILRASNGIDIVDRRRAYEKEGWSGFDEDAAEPLTTDPRDPRNMPVPPPV